MADALLRLRVMDTHALLSLALQRLAAAVGDLLRNGRDPSRYVLTVTAADSPIGEVLLEGEGARADEAVCIMLPLDTVARVLEAHAFDAATVGRIAEWLGTAPGPDRYRVVAIGRAAVEAIAIETSGASDDDTDEPPASLLLH